MLKVLIIEDDRNLAEAVSRVLITHDFAPTVVHDGDEGLELALNENFDAIVLDIMLPGACGIEICETLRARGSKAPIIIASARETIDNRVDGLNAGADDYMTKPFAPAELIARLNAVIRRANPVASPQDRIRYGNLEFIPATGEICCGSEIIPLSEKEAILMKELIADPGRICSKQTLVGKIWPDGEQVDVNNVEAYISFLRKKMSFINTNVYIRTLRKIGYRLEIE